MVATLLLTIFEHAILVGNVYINGVGPFRMVIDTGAQSTSVTPDTAVRIGLKPEFRVHHVTAAGSRLANGAYTTVRTKGFEQQAVETIICDLPAMRTFGQIDGVLGQSWLQRFNYSIDFTAGSLRLEGEAPAGERIPFTREDGRPAIRTRIGDEEGTMVLDSGTPAVVLFGGAGDSRGVLLRTNVGTARAAEKRVSLYLPVLGRTKVTAAVVENGGRQSGLLPLRMFSSVYVNNNENYVVLRPR